MAQLNFQRLCAAHGKVAVLVTHDPVFVPIFLRLEAEIAAAKIEGDVISRARAIAARQKAIARYHNRSVDALQILQELIQIAKDLQKEPTDNLSPEERAFYDALAQNSSAVEVMSNDQLRIIAAELVTTVRNNSGTDWWKRENVRAKMRVAVKAILRRHGYPPDLTTEAVKTVIRQAEALARAL